MANFISSDELFQSFAIPASSRIEDAPKNLPFFQKRSRFLITRSFLVGVIFQVELDEAGKEEKRNSKTFVATNTGPK